MEQEVEFSEEFKRNVIQLLILNVKSRAQLENQYKIPAGLLGVWQRELSIAQEDAESVSATKPVGKAIHDANRNDHL